MQIYKKNLVRFDSVIYNTYMKCLIITNDENSRNKINSCINKNYPNSWLLECNLESFDINSIEKKLSSFSCCVIAIQSQESLNENLIFLIGYLAAKKIPVFTNIKESFFKLFEDIYSFDDINKLADYLKSQKKQILNQISKNQSMQSLLQKGIPFSPYTYIFYINRKNIDIVKLFINSGIDINSCDNDGTSALNIACRNDDLEMVKLLISNGAQIEIVSHDRGYTPLMDAVFTGNLEISKYLIKKGADVNKTSKDGIPMIVLAVGADKIDLCKLLAQNGADVDVPDAMGMSAYNYAKLFKKDKILSILEKYHKE